MEIGVELLVLERLVWPRQIVPRVALFLSRLRDIQGFRKDLAGKTICLELLLKGLRTAISLAHEAFNELIDLAIFVSARIEALYLRRSSIISSLGSVRLKPLVHRSMLVKDCRDALNIVSLNLAQFLHIPVWNLLEQLGHPGLNGLRGFLESAQELGIFGTTLNIPFPETILLLLMRGGFEGLLRLVPDLAVFFLL